MSYFFTRDILKAYPIHRGNVQMKTVYEVRIEEALNNLNTARLGINGLGNKREIEAHLRNSLTIEQMQRAKKEV